MTEHELYLASQDLQDLLDQIKTVGTEILGSHTYRYRHYVDTSPLGSDCRFAKITYKEVKANSDSQLILELSELMSHLLSVEESLCQQKQS